MVITGAYIPEKLCKNKKKIISKKANSYNYFNYYGILTNIILFMTKIKVLRSKNIKKILFYLFSIEFFFSKFAFYFIEN